MDRIADFQRGSYRPGYRRAASTVEQGLSGTYSGFSPEPLITGQTITAQAALFLIIVWATGVIVFATWQLYCYRKFVRTLEHSRTAVPRDSQAVEQLSLIKEPLGLKRNVRLAYSSALRSPVLVGLWKPTIYLPKENIVNVNMDMIMRHELIHLKRKDLWVKAFTLGASALHWFNPSYTFSVRIFTPGASCLAMKKLSERCPMPSENGTGRRF